MIEVDDLSKSYGQVRAVQNVSFCIEAGDVVGFLGPNGAGKTTTLRVMAGFLGATAGRVRIAGFDVAEQRMEARRSLGYMPEAFPLYPEMRVAEYLRFRAELKGVRRRGRRREVSRTLTLAGAREMADVRIGHLSKGYRQRVGLADALLGSPPLLILDEPTAGLDPNQMREVRQLLRGLAEKHTILLSTHILSEVEATCDRAIVIARGRLVAEGTIAELRRQRRETSRWEIVVGGEPDEALAVLLAAPGVATAEVCRAPDGRGRRILVDLEPAPDSEGADEPLSDAGERVEPLVYALADARIGLRRLTPVAASLEQVFSELTADRDNGVDGPNAEETP